MTVLNIDPAPAQRLYQLAKAKALHDRDTCPVATVPDELTGGRLLILHERDLPEVFQQLCERQRRKP